MADEILRSRHAFGSVDGVDAALESGKIDAYDILFLTNGDKHTVGWIDKNGNKIILEDKTGVVSVEELPQTGEKETVYICDGKFYFWDGEKFESPNAVDGVDEATVDKKVETAVANANAYTDEKLEVALEDYLSKNYKVAYRPEGTLVDYRDKEIRVMCPANTEWVHQQSGEGSDANSYYIGFKAYAPFDDVVSFKEDLAEKISDETMYYFEGNDFSGVDENGRKYSIVWLPVAKYNEATGAWTYHGSNSSVEKYIGWYYSVEWYNAGGVVVASDCIRINLSNESCHSSIEPYYIGNIMTEVDAKIEEKITEINTGYEIIEF